MILKNKNSFKLDLTLKKITLYESLYSINQ